MLLYLFFGAKDTSITAVRDEVSALFRLPWEARDSGHIGTYYRIGERDAEHALVEPNVDEDPDELPHPLFAEYSVIVRIHKARANSADAVRQSLTNLTFLEQQET